jgi:hypothetical protein
VRCVWVFDPAARRVHVHVRDPGQANGIVTTELGEDDVLDGREILPGLCQPLIELVKTILR